MTRILNIFYRPPENHVAVIYSRWGKFKRFAQPDRWTVLSSFERVDKEVKLDTRTAILRLENVLTRDRVAINLDMKVFYSVDLRQVQADRLLQVLHFESESAFEEIVKTGVTDIARNTVVISKTFDELATPEGRAYLKQALSIQVSHRVQSFGIVMNRFGVSIMNLQPNETFHQALEEGSAAKAIGSAAADRIRPVLEQFRDQDQQKAFLTLLFQVAAAVAKTGETPDIFFPDTDHSIPGDGLLGRRHNPMEPTMPRISPDRKPKSIAGD